MHAVVTNGTLAGVITNTDGTYGKTGTAQVQVDPTVAVRVYPAVVPARTVTRPVAAYPVRVEVDNDRADDTLELEDKDKKVDVLKKKK